MSEHTPGPWERRRSWIEQSEPGVKQIARVKFPVSTKEAAADPIEEAEAFANARLIAAAPDLLAACRDASGAIENVLDNLSRELESLPEPKRTMAVRLLTAAADQCRAVVAKTEGGRL